MALVTEEPIDLKCKIESVYHDETAAFEANICANHDETSENEPHSCADHRVQKIKSKLKRESQKRDENILQSEENNENRKLFIECKIHPDTNTLYRNDTEEENCGNDDSMVDINMSVENGVSEEVQVESESICVVEDNFFKIKKGRDGVSVQKGRDDINTAEEINDDNASVNFGGNESSLPESVNSYNNDESTPAEIYADVNMIVEENAQVDFEWQKLFTPSPTNFTYPNDEKEIENLAATLSEMKYRLLGRDLHDVITMCNFASQWKTISEECKNYVYQRMSLLYLAATRGWRYALAASYPHNAHPQKRPAVENLRGGYKPRKKRRRLFYFRHTAIPNEQIDQAVSSHPVTTVEAT